jgi:RNA polymerase sigma factor (sigma-70 family)
MSPASLRRYRAERLLREEFRSLRASVIASARGSLRACGVRLDESDLEACYAQAWQGLYAATLAGEPIRNPAGWLALATFRRAIDEQRARARVGLRDREERAGEERRAAIDPSLYAGVPHAGLDVAAELDRRIELRRVFEALRLRLSAREQQAAALCYLQGLSRAEAARTMGVSEPRMRKLMEGRGAGRPGVAGKMAALLETIREGAWCEEQASLMRGLAYGMLDPAGERHRLALAHTSACPACRAYVASLRGLAALVPPAPALIQLLLTGAASTKAAGLGAALGHSAAGAPGLSSGAAGAGVTSPGAGTAGPLAAGALPSAAASGVAGAGAASGGWLLAGGGIGAKLAAGCLLALGVGAGCAVLGTGRGAGGAHESAHLRPRAHTSASAAGAAPDAASVVLRSASSATGPAAGAAALGAHSGGASRASREFGPEQGGALASAEPPPPSAASLAPRRPATARVARAGAELALGATPASSEAGVGGSAPARSSGPAAAQREFSPG